MTATGVGVAILGSGGIAREHAAALARLPGVEVRYVVGGDLARSRGVAALAPGAVATTDLERALADPAVQGVDVCGVTPLHAPLTIRAARAGKHVHVEKPAALSMAGLHEMIAEVRARRLTLMTGQTVRFQPGVAALHRAVAAGEIGAVHLLRVGWYTGYVWAGGWRGWQLDPARSGGHPVHNGTHAFDLLVWLMRDRRPTRVFVRSFRTLSPDVPVPDSFHATVRFDDGSLALVELSYALRERGASLRRVLAVGDRGTLRHEDDGDSGLHSEAARAPSASVDGAIGAQMAHWAAVLRGETEPITTPRQMCLTLATALAAQRSLVTGRAVDVPEAADVR
ncbi:inositol 2-dehydrogenase [Streptosporangium violaceochromogenes]|nr:inositol 2-dehydrogenase [Streptosporangium violaceochromogenes]